MIEFTVPMRCVKVWLAATLRVAVPSLVPLLAAEEDDVRQSATEIIRKIGKPAVEPLATALAEADDRLKTRVLKVLDRMGYKPKAKPEASVELPRLT